MNNLVKHSVIIEVRNKNKCNIIKRYRMKYIKIFLSVKNKISGGTRFTTGM